MYSPIKAGMIKRNKNLPSQQNMRYEMIFMDERQLMDIVKLQDFIIQSLTDKEIFRTHPADYFRNHLQTENSVIGTFTNEGLIAYSR